MSGGEGIQAHASNETVQHAAVFDHAMLQAAEQLGYVGMLHDALTRRRFHLGLGSELGAGFAE